MRIYSITRRLLLATAAPAAFFATSAIAQEATVQQDAPAASMARGSGDIIVTARKRDETLMSVPVVVSAVSAETLSNRGITNLDGLARVVPQLMVGNQGGSLQGGNISIRGISGPDQNPFGDSAVSFNIDGVQVAKANVRRMSDFDTAQVEVLKGPQALFFGKNSPAGIVSIRSNDPTTFLEAGVKAGYEFEAQEIRTEAFVSSPLTETLGVRIAGMFSDMRGDLKDAVPEDSIYKVSDHNPDSRTWALRGTLKWEPSSQFDARLKANYSKVKMNGVQANTGYISCPDGFRQSFSGIDQCEVGSRNTNAGYGPLVSTFPGTLNFFRPDGKNFITETQILSGLEMNYHVSDAVSITSVTGFYRSKMDECANFNNDTGIVLPSCGMINNSEFSQELRIASDYEGPINFIGGAYYSRTRSTSGAHTYLFGGDFDMFPGGVFGPGTSTGGPTSPTLLNNYLLKQRGTTYSAYLQLSYKPIDVVEINVGGRYTKEKKHLPLVRSGGGLQDGNVGTLILDESTEIDDMFIATRRGSWNDFSPEVTLSYRPNDDLTLFGSYKHGFLSGGFNSGSVTFTVPDFDLSYDPQTIKGFEVGAKAALLDNTLRVNLAAYTYKVTDLQVSNVFNSTNTISNAGAVKIKGVEFDFNYDTPLPGFSLHGAVAYNHGKYSSYPNAPCYGGQTAAMGCIDPDGNPLTPDSFQNLSGTELIRAPKWNLAGGFAYETLVGGDYKIGLSGDVTHSSSFLTDASSAPNGRMPRYTLLDGTIRFGPADDQWELALIGRNLTNKYYYVASSLVPFAASQNPGVLSDRFASFSRGREIMARVTIKFSAN